MCPLDVNVAFHEITEFDTEFWTVEVFSLLGYATVQIGSMVTNISNKLPVYIIKHTKGEVSTTLWQKQKSGILDREFTWKRHTDDYISLITENDLKYYCVGVFKKKTNGTLLITNEIQKWGNSEGVAMVVPLTHGIQHCFSSLKLCFLPKKFRLLSLTLKFWLLSITFLPG